MQTLWQDLRYGARMLVKKPGFTLGAVLTLALGIGATTAIFSIIDAVLLRPLSYVAPDRLVKVLEANPQKGMNRMMLSLGDFNEWKSLSRSFEEMAALANVSLRVTDIKTPEEITGNQVSANFFSMLGVKPALGRTFLPEDERPGSALVALLTYGYWAERYGADSQVIGQTITLNGQIHIIAGVLPATFKQDFGSFPGRARVWTLAGTDRQELARRGPGGYSVIARLKLGVTVEQANFEMKAIAEGLAQTHPESNTGIGATVLPLHGEVTSRQRPSLLIIAAAVGLVLLIACANVASLTLARGVEREREVTVRLALGAGRWRIVRQLLTENLLLSVLGGACGLLLAVWLLAAVTPLIPRNIPRMENIALDWRATLFTLFISVATGIIFGLAPALHASKISLNEALKDAAGQTATSWRSRQLYNTLVVLQIALTLLLLTGAGLITRSLIRLYGADPGFDTSNLLTMNVALPRAKKEEPSALRGWSQFWNQALERARQLPGAQGAAVVIPLPLSDSTFNKRISLTSSPAPNPEAQLTIGYSIISHNYFQLMGIKLLDGRYLSEDDTSDSIPVVIVNESFARRLLPPGQSPLGQSLTLDQGTKFEKVAFIVGVVADSRARLDQQPKPQIYQSFLQFPSPSMYLLTRTAGDPLTLVAGLRGVVRALDKNQPVGAIRTMDEIWAEYTVAFKFYLATLGSFAVVALALAAVGIYGIVSLAVSQRTREIGVRTALGAQAGDVLRLVIRQGLKLIVAGVSIGLITALTLTRLMKGLIYDVSAADPLTLAFVTVLLSSIALLACYLPARRATRIDPMIALRYE